MGAANALSSSNARHGTIGLLTMRAGLDRRALLGISSWRDRLGICLSGRSGRPTPRRGPSAIWLQIKAETLDNCMHIAYTIDRESTQSVARRGKMQNQATHASWKGAITFGMVSVPVKLYTATEERKVSFHQVHEACGVRTRSQTVCPSCDRTIERSEIVKGYEEGGELTLVTEADLEGLPLRSTRNIDVLAFV